MSGFTYKSEPLLCAELRSVQTRVWEVPSRGEPSTCFAVGVRAELLRPGSCLLAVGGSTRVTGRKCCGLSRETLEHRLALWGPCVRVMHGGVGLLSAGWGPRGAVPVTL